MSQDEKELQKMRAYVDKANEDLPRGFGITEKEEAAITSGRSPTSKESTPKP